MLHRGSIIIVSLLIVFSGSFAFAQKNAAPSGQFGIGIYGLNSWLPEPPGGMTFTYALSHTMQLGSYFGLDVASGDIGNLTEFTLKPFFRYIIDAAVSPFFQGGMNIISAGTTGVGLFFGGGLAYYLNQTFGIHAEMDVMQIGFSPSGIIFGFSNVKAGVEWYMGK